MDLGLHILHISGLDNYSIPHPNSMIRPASFIRQRHAQCWQRG